MLLDDILGRLNALPEAERNQAVEAAVKATAGMAWLPSPGPQTEAYFSPADVLLYGGQGGGGKSSLILGLALTSHRRSLIMRRQSTELGALIEETIRFNGTRDGFNGSPPQRLRTTDGRLIEFGAAKSLGDEQSWQGQPHDFLGVDEATQFLELQIRFLMGWLRPGAGVSSDQRCRAVLATNPPLSAEGEWIIGFFRPWLDLTHPKPAKPGELRWFVTAPDGTDLEVPGPEPIELDGRKLIPKSRSFIPAALADNPFLAKSGYQAQLDALPEPIRSAVRDGNFMAARKDDEWQVIPTQWIREAQARWTPKPPEGVPMTALGVDVAQGGEDETVLAPRHGHWFAPLISVPGAKTPRGADVAGLVIATRRNGATVVIDMGGGYGGAAFEHLKANDPLFPVVSYKGAEKSRRRTKDRQLGFVNKRSQAWWQFREALDPGQPGGSPIALPDDPMLVGDLTAPRFEVGTNGIAITAKKKVTAALGRSTDRGDAVVMSWFAGVKEVMDARATMEQGSMRNKAPVVVLGHQSARRSAGRGR